MFKLVVLSVVLAVATASPSGIWGARLAAPVVGAWGAPWAGVVAPVVAPVAAHVAAPVAVGHGHWLKKRSLVAPLAVAPVVAAPVAWGHSAAWAAPAPVAVAAPVAHWGARVGHHW